MFRNLSAQQIRQTAFQNAIAGFRAQQAATQPQWGTPPIGVAAAPRPGVLYLQQTYSIASGTKDPAWAAQSVADRSIGGHAYSDQYSYAKAKSGGLTSGFGFSNIADMFGPFHISLRADGTGDTVQYVGDARHMDTLSPSGGGNVIGGGTKVSDFLFNNDFNMATPDGMIKVEKYLYQNQSAGGYPGVGPTNDTSVVARAIAAVAAQSQADRNANSSGDCPPFGNISKTQAQALYDNGKGRYSGCVNEIRQMAAGAAGGGGGGGAAPPSACSTGYRKYIAIYGGSPCAAGQAWEKDPANATCGRCAGATCPDGYSSTQPSCGPGYRMEPHPTSPNCWACNAACPGGGYVPPDQATCPAAQQQTDTYYSTGCVKCGPACPPNYTAAQPSCPAGQAAPQDQASGCWGPCPTCPPGYFVLPAGAPFTCPPWQQRKVDEASGCVACETAPNCFPTASGLACGAGQTPQIYGDFTCCQAAPTSPPPSSEPPSTAPATTPTTAPPGALQAGIGLGGGIALAVVAIIAGKFFFGGKGAAGAAAPEPRTSARPRGGIAELRERLYR